MIKKQFHPWYFATIFISTLFLTVSFFVNNESFRSFDYNSMVFLQSALPRGVDMPFSVLTVSGSTEVTVVLLFVVFLSIFLKKRKIFLGLLLYLSIFIIELLGKLFIYHPIPPPFFNRYILPIRMPSSFIVHTNYSFPSGHMARSTYVCVIFLFLILKEKHKRRKNFFILLLISYIALMFLSRVYLGEHWFSDVVGGLLLGASIASFSVSFW